MRSVLFTTKNVHLCNFVHLLCVLWAGTILGGSVIAAPAKFRVADLTLPVALQVGRAQFFWVAIAESILFTAIVFLCVLGRRQLSRGTVVALGIVALVFVLQHFAINPVLQARSDRIIAGEKVPESNLHLVYVVAEMVKLFLLATTSFWALGIRRAGCENHPVRETA